MKNIASVDQIKQAFSEVESCLEKLKKSIESDIEEGYEIFVPGVDEKEASEAAFKSLSRTRNEDNIPKSGLLCASQTTVKKIESLNQARKAFKVSCHEVKSMDGNESNPNRGEALAIALRAIEQQSADLRTLEAQIQVLPANMRSVSWTWQMKHPMMKQYTVAEALNLAENLADKKAQQAAKIDLNQLSPDEKLVVKKEMPPQLKANIQFYDGGDLFKKTISVSGILIVPSKTLPVHCWRNKPEKPSERIARPKKVEEQMFVPVLQMYRYVSN